MRQLMILCCLALMGCGPATDPDTQSFVPAQHQLSKQEIALQWQQVISELSRPGIMTMRRVEGPLEPTDGDILGSILHFEGLDYRVLSDEQRVPPIQERALRNALAASLQHTGHTVLFCDWDPGVYVKITRFVDDDPHQAVVMAMGLLCFHCGEWKFVFTSSAQPLYEMLVKADYDVNLRAAQSTFLDDAALQAIRPK